MADLKDRIGQSIGDYRLLRPLGKGTFGTVYQAEHLYDHTLAAVKVLNIPLTNSSNLRTFLDEARTVRLRHPHIVLILDFGLSHRDNLPYLVMAYADKGSLRDNYPRGSKLFHQTIDTYVQQLASALQYAHDHRVIHRDVKPENMLVCSDGTVQLGDFGIAKISELASHSSLQHGAGTPAYAAPEQIRGKSCFASDQYALAVVVYEWLAGQLPFQGEPLAVMGQHINVLPPSLRAISPEVSTQVEQVIFKALAKSPGDRYPTITHFALDLHIALQVRTVPTQSPTNLNTLQHVSPLQANNTLTPSQTINTIPPSQVQNTLTPPQANNTIPTTKNNNTIPPSLPSQSTSKGQKFSFMTLNPRKLGILVLCLVLLFPVISVLYINIPHIISANISQSAEATKTASKSKTATASVPLATATAAPLATATAATYDYQQWVKSNGIQFGFDAAHTHFNPYEQMLNTKNVTQLTQLWSYPTQDSISSSPAVADGIAYIGSWDGNLYAFDTKCRPGCQPLWHYQTGGPIYSSPAVVNGTIYIGSHDGNLYAFDEHCSQPCKPLWYYHAMGAIESSPTVANGMLYVGSLDGNLYAFSTTCSTYCQPQWQYHTGGWISYSSPAVANGMVYVGSYDGKLYAFSTACSNNCQPLWYYQTGGPIHASPTVANGIVYASSYDHTLYAFSTTCNSNCQPLWSFTTGNIIASSPAVANGIVYIGSDDHTLYAFDAECGPNCQPRWSFTTNGNINSQPTVANGVVYVGSWDDNLYAFDTTCHLGCQPLWSFHTGGSIESSPAVANGVVYVGSYDGKLHAFGLPPSS